MEVLVAISFVVSGLVMGVNVFDWVLRYRSFKDLKERQETLNKNIDAFGKAFADFNARSLEIESRFSTMEFKVNGITGK